MITPAWLTRAHFWVYTHRTKFANLTFIITNNYFFKFIQYAIINLIRIDAAIKIIFCIVLTFAKLSVR